ncbi:MAG: hypothetical protein ABIO48_03710 [Pedococcus sp.]
MALRGHGPRLIIEMSVAMVVPFLVLLAPLAVGAISDGTLMLVGHTAMFLTMLAAMLLRRRDYTEHHATSPWRRLFRRPSRARQGATRREAQPGHR